MTVEVLRICIPGVVFCDVRDPDEVESRRFLHMVVEGEGDVSEPPRLRFRACCGVDWSLKPVHSRHGRISACQTNNSLDSASAPQYSPREKPSDRLSD